MTAKEWRDKNPIPAEEGNIRDYADLLHLIVLNNLENINSEFIKMSITLKIKISFTHAQPELLIYNKNDNILKGSD